MLNYRVVIPTYQAGKHLETLLPALKLQGLNPADVLVVDSSSQDDTVSRFKEFGAEIIVIPQADFNHGGTRRMAAEHCADIPYLILITQDAIPTAGAFDRLLTAFENPTVGMAYGRQLPRPQARAIERHARLLNYPPDASHVRRFDDRQRYGVKTTFSSNSFAAYRTSALLQIGNFPEESFFGEDQITAGRLLIAGWELAYVSEAAVVHSHGYGPFEDFRRYFDVGVFHSRNRWLLETFGKAEGEGLRFVKAELAYLLRHQPLAIFSAGLRTLLKYAGYKLGMMEAGLSPRTKKSLSMAPDYWNEGRWCPSLGHCQDPDRAATRTLPGEKNCSIRRSN